MRNLHQLQPKGNSGLKTAFSGFLAAGYFLINCALVHSAEANFWADRRKMADRSQAPSRSQQFAALPSGSDPARVFHDLPSVQAAGLNRLTPALAEQLERHSTPDSARRVKEVLKSLPPAHGSIRKVSLAPVPRPSAPIVVHIQDVHMNGEAQMHIGRAVDELIRRKAAGLVALEGTFGPIDVGQYRAHPDRDLIRNLADHLLKEFKISGPVHAAMTGEGDLPPLVGIDHPDHYRGNVEAYRRSAGLVADRKERLARWRLDVEARKDAVYNPALRAFDREVENYRSNRTSLGDHVRSLASRAPAGPQARLFLDALAQEKALDFGRVESERGDLIRDITRDISPASLQALLEASVAYRLGEVRHADYYRFLREFCLRAGLSLADYPSMEAYIRYVIAADKLDASKLFEEVRSLEKSAYAQVARTPEEKALLAESRRLHLTGKLVDFSLTPDEWTEYEETNSPARHSGESWNPEVVQEMDSGFRRGKEMGDLVSFESFYQEAQARDQAMTENLLSALSSIPSDGSPAAILVTGGFHAPGIEKLLTRAGVTVVSYIPKLTKIDDDKGISYLSVFDREKTPLEKLFDGDRLFTSPNPAKAGLAEGAGIGAAWKAAQGGSEEDARAVQSGLDADPEPETVEVLEAAPPLGATVRVEEADGGAADVSVQLDREGRILSAPQKSRRTLRGAARRSVVRVRRFLGKDPRTVRAVRKGASRAARAVRRQARTLRSAPAAPVRLALPSRRGGRRGSLKPSDFTVPERLLPLVRDAVSRAIHPGAGTEEGAGAMAAFVAEKGLAAPASGDAGREASSDSDAGVGSSSSGDRTEEIAQLADLYGEGADIESEIEGASRELDFQVRTLLEHPLSPQAISLLANPFLDSAWDSWLNGHFLLLVDRNVVLAMREKQIIEAVIAEMIEVLRGEERASVVRLKEKMESFGSYSSIRLPEEIVSTARRLAHAGVRLMENVYSKALLLRELGLCESSVATLLEPWNEEVVQEWVRLHTSGTVPGDHRHLMTQMDPLDPSKEEFSVYQRGDVPQPLHEGGMREWVKIRQVLLETGKLLWEWGDATAAARIRRAAGHWEKAGKPFFPRTSLRNKGSWLPNMDYALHKAWRETPIVAAVQAAAVGGLLAGGRIETVVKFLQEWLPGDLAFLPLLLLAPLIFYFGHVFKNRAAMGGGAVIGLTLLTFLSGLPLLLVLHGHPVLGFALYALLTAALSAYHQHVNNPHFWARVRRAFIQAMIVFSMGPSLAPNRPGGPPPHAITIDMEDSWEGRTIPDYYMVNEGKGEDNTGYSVPKSHRLYGRYVPSVTLGGMGTGFKVYSNGTVGGNPVSPSKFKYNPTGTQMLWVENGDRGFEALSRGSFWSRSPEGGFQYDTRATPLQLSSRFYSPIIAGNYQESSYPISIFELSARNAGGVNASVSWAVPLEVWARLAGWDPSDVNVDMTEDDEGRHVVLTNPKDETRKVALSVPAGVSVELKDNFQGTGLPALRLTTEVKAGATAVVPFSVALDFPKTREDEISEFRVSGRNEGKDTATLSWDMPAEVRESISGWKKDEVEVEEKKDGKRIVGVVLKNKDPGKGQVTLFAITDGSSLERAPDSPETGLPVFRIKMEAKPGQAVQVSLAADLDVPGVESNQPARRYTQFFTDPQTRAADMAKTGLRERSSWSDQVKAWQKRIEEADLSDDEKAALFQEVAYLAQGGTLWYAAEKPGEAGHFYYSENSRDYRFYNTSDVFFEGGLIIKALWPELYKDVVRELNKTILLPRGEDMLHKNSAPVGPNSEWTKTGPRTLPGQVVHDMRGYMHLPGLDSLQRLDIRPNAYNFQHSTIWKDLNAKHNLSVLLGAQGPDGTYDEEFVRANWEGVKAAVQYDRDRMDEMAKKLGRPVHLPYHENFADQTFDTIEMEGPSAYTGILWLANLVAAIKMAEMLGDTETQAKLEKWRDEAAAAVEGLWDEERGYYLFCPEKPDLILANVMSGVSMAQILGLSLPGITEERIKSTLTAVYEHNFKKAGNSRGAVNITLRSGKALHNPVDQEEEVWVGVNYVLVRMMRDSGMNAEAADIMAAVQKSLKEFGFLGRTPEAYSARRRRYRQLIFLGEVGRKLGKWFRSPPGTARALDYMRAGAIGALLLPSRRPAPSAAAEQSPVTAGGPAGPDVRNASPPVSTVGAVKPGGWFADAVAVAATVAAFGLTIYILGFDSVKGVNLALAGGSGAVGNLLSQVIEGKSKKKPFSLRQAVAVVVFTLLVDGFIVPEWYLGFLTDHFGNEITLASIAGRALAQVPFASACYLAFIPFMEIAAGRAHPREAFAGFWRKFNDLLVGDVGFYSLFVQGFGAGLVIPFIAGKLDFSKEDIEFTRFVFILVAGVFWNAFMSWRGTHKSESLVARALRRVLGLSSAEFKPVPEAPEIPSHAVSLPMGQALKGDGIKSFNVFDEGARAPAGFEGQYFPGHTLGGFGTPRMDLRSNGAGDGSAQPEEITYDPSGPALFWLETPEGPKELKEGTWWTRYPQGGYEFATAATPLRLASRFFSPVIPGAEETSYPISIFHLSAANPTGEAQSAAWNIPLANWVRMAGWDPRDVIVQEKKRWRFWGPTVGVVIRNPLLEGVGERGSIALAVPRGATMSLVDKGFEQTGLPALRVSMSVPAGRSAEIPLSLAMDFPEAGDVRYLRKYTDHFGANGQKAWKMARLGARKAGDWRARVEAWIRAVADHPAIPEHIKPVIFQELAYKAHGGTLWNSAKDEKAPNFFGLLEGRDFKFYDTLDVMYQGIWDLLALWPEQAEQMLSDYAEAVLEEDPAIVQYQHPYVDEDGILRTYGPRKVRNRAPHDLGGVDADGVVRVGPKHSNNYQYQNPNRWVDLGSKFALMVLAVYQRTGNKGFLRKAWPSVRAALESDRELMQARAKKQPDASGDLPIHNGKDTTFDSVDMRGNSAYSGGLWLAALDAGQEIARVLDEDAGQMGDWRQRGAEAFKTLWSEVAGQYLHIRDRPDIVMADVLSGVAYARQLGLPTEDYAPEANVKKTLETIFHYNMRHNRNGPFAEPVPAGLRNMVSKLSSRIPESDEDRIAIENYSRHMGEVWVGVNYHLAHFMHTLGMEEASKKVIDAVQFSLRKYGLTGRTPEAYWPSQVPFHYPPETKEFVLNEGTFRAARYSRPGVIGLFLPPDLFRPSPRPRLAGRIAAARVVAPASNAGMREQALREMRDYVLSLSRMAKAGRLGTFREANHLMQVWWRQKQSALLASLDGEQGIETSGDLANSVDLIGRTLVAATNPQYFKRSEKKSLADVLEEIAGRIDPKGGVAGARVVALASSPKKTSEYVEHKAPGKETSAMMYAFFAAMLISAFRFLNLEIDGMELVWRFAAMSLPIHALLSVVFALTHTGLDDEGRWVVRFFRHDGTVWRPQEAPVFSWKGHAVLWDITWAALRFHLPLPGAAGGAALIAWGISQFIGPALAPLVFFYALMLTIIPGLELSVYLHKRHNRPFLGKVGGARRKARPAETRPRSPSREDLEGRRRKAEEMQGRSSFLDRERAAWEKTLTKFYSLLKNHRHAEEKEEIAVNISATHSALVENSEFLRNRYDIRVTVPALDYHFVREDLSSLEAFERGVARWRAMHLPGVNRFSILLGVTNHLLRKGQSAGSYEEDKGLLKQHGLGDRDLWAVRTLLYTLEGRLREPYELRRVEGALRRLDRARMGDISFLTADELVDWVELSMSRPRSGSRPWVRGIVSVAAVVGIQTAAPRLFAKMISGPAGSAFGDDLSRIMEELLVEFFDMIDNPIHWFLLAALIFVRSVAPGARAIRHYRSWGRVDYPMMSLAELNRRDLWKKDLVSGLRAVRTTFLSYLIGILLVVLGVWLWKRLSLPEDVPVPDFSVFAQMDGGPSASRLIGDITIIPSPGITDISSWGEFLSGAALVLILIFVVAAVVSGLIAMLEPESKKSPWLGRAKSSATSVIFLSILRSLIGLMQPDASPRPSPDPVVLPSPRDEAVPEAPEDPTSADIRVISRMVMALKEIHGQVKSGEIETLYDVGQEVFWERLGFSAEDAKRAAIFFNEADAETIHEDLLGALPSSARRLPNPWKADDARVLTRMTDVLRRDQVRFRNGEKVGGYNKEEFWRRWMTSAEAGRATDLFLSAARVTFLTGVIRALERRMDLGIPRPPPAASSSDGIALAMPREGLSPEEAKIYVGHSAPVRESNRFTNLFMGISVAANLLVGSLVLRAQGMSDGVWGLEAALKGMGAFPPEWTGMVVGGLLLLNFAVFFLVNEFYFVRGHRAKGWDGVWRVGYYQYEDAGDFEQGELNYPMLRRWMGEFDSNEDSFDRQEGLILKILNDARIRQGSPLTDKDILSVINMELLPDAGLLSAARNGASLLYVENSAVRAANKAFFREQFPVAVVDAKFRGGWVLRTADQGTPEAERVRAFFRREGMSIHYALIAFSLASFVLALLSSIFIPGLGAWGVFTFPFVMVLIWIKNFPISRLAHLRANAEPIKDQIAAAMPEASPLPGRRGAVRQAALALLAAAALQAPVVGSGDAAAVAAYRAEAARVTSALLEGLPEEAGSRDSTFLGALKTLDEWTDDKEALLQAMKAARTEGNLPVLTRAQAFGGLQRAAIQSQGADLSAVQRAAAEEALARGRMPMGSLVVTRESLSSVRSMLEAYKGIDGIVLLALAEPGLEGEVRALVAEDRYSDVRAVVKVDGGLSVLPEAPGLPPRPDMGKVDEAFRRMVAQADVRSLAGDAGDFSFYLGLPTGWDPVWTSLDERFSLVKKERTFFADFLKMLPVENIRLDLLGLFSDLMAQSA